MLSKLLQQLLTLLIFVASAGPAAHQVSQKHCPDTFENGLLCALQLAPLAASAEASLIIVTSSKGALMLSLSS